MEVDLGEAEQPDVDKNVAEIGNEDTVPGILAEEDSCVEELDSSAIVNTHHS